MACNSRTGFPLLGQCEVTDWTYHWSVRLSHAQFDTTHEFTENPNIVSGSGPFTVFSIHRATVYRISNSANVIEKNVALSQGRWSVSWAQGTNVWTGLGWDFDAGLTINPNIRWFLDDLNVGEFSDGTFVGGATLQRFSTSISTGPTFYFDVPEGGGEFTARFNSYGQLDYQLNQLNASPGRLRGNLFPVLIP